MSSLLQSLSFVTPAALWFLLALPVLWWLLRFVPPRPQPVQFPPIRILLGLDPKLETPDKTPWWLLLLRLAMAALLILGVAHPEWITGRIGTGVTGNTMVVVDNGWAAAKDWPRRQEYLMSVIEESRRSGGQITLVPAIKDAAVALQPQAAAEAATKAGTLVPAGLSPDRNGLIASLRDANLPRPDRIIWLSDGLIAGSFAQDISAMYSGSPLTVVAPSPSELPLALATPRIDGGDIAVDVLKPATVGETVAAVQARAANGRVLAEQVVTLSASARNAGARLALPTELRNEVQSLTIATADHAGARQLLDDRWRRKTVALQSGVSIESTQPLLSPLHYIARALEPTAELYEPKTPEDLNTLLDGGVSMVVLADIGVVSSGAATNLATWVEKGGLLVRFAGPRMAAAVDDLVPVQLREGGRELGSALAWEEPQTLQSFPDSSPFAGLTVDPRATIARQVLAEPDGELSNRTWASLSDGTPLVTAARRGKGLVVLFHVTANPDWSNLPLTGLFADMLRRITDLAPPAGSAAASGTFSASTAESYVPVLELSGRGDLVTPGADAQPIAASAFDKALPTRQTPAGIYQRGSAERALNLSITADNLLPLGPLPSGSQSADYTPPTRSPLAPYLFLAVLALFVADALASLIMGGGMARLRPATTAAAILIGAFALLPASPVDAQEKDDFAMQASLQTRIAFVKTGKPDIDEVSDAGLKGLGFFVNDRTSVSLADPIGVDLERDDIVFFPLIYWPVDPDAEEPPAAVTSKIDSYMKNGGTILFDLRDDGLGAGSLGDGTSPANEALRRILGKLDIPPLEQVADRHVLTRSFYLLDTFPGRYADGPLWVEASTGSASTDPGTADGVSSVIIGSNDYAAAWAMDSSGSPMFAVIPGNDRQREFAFRTGINIVMYALTGNYKADQVHVPALLERLGQ